MAKTGLALVLVLGIVGVAGAADVYTDEASFLAAIPGGAGFLLEDFNGYTYGSYVAPTLTLGPVNGFSCIISATGPGSNNLYSGDGNMSTDSALDALRIDFTGPNPTYSTGGWFFAGDIMGGYIAQEVTLTLSDGTVYGPFVPASATTFVGFINDTTPLTWMTIDAADTPANGWPTMDHYYVGHNPIPVELQSFTIE